MELTYTANWETHGIFQELVIGPYTALVWPQGDRFFGTIKANSRVIFGPVFQLGATEQVSLEYAEGYIERHNADGVL